MVLELLAALVGAVALPHGHGPDPPGHAADHRVLGVHPVGEEERQVGREVVDVHAAREVALDVGEAVGEGERELADGVRPGLGDVVAGDRHGVEVAHLARDEPLLDVGHHPQGELGGEDAGVLALVLLEDVGLHRAADVGQRVGGQLLALGVVGVAPLLIAEGVDPLVDRGVEVVGEDRRGRTVDRHRDGRGGRAQVEAAVEHLHVLERRDRDAGGADLAVDVGTGVGIAAVERHRVERRGEALGVGVGREHLEPPVGAERVALAREHPGRVLALALEAEHARRVREPARQVLAAQEAQDLGVLGVAGERDAGDPAARERLAGERRVQLLVADAHDELVTRVVLDGLRPAVEQLGVGGRERLLGGRRAASSTAVADQLAGGAQVLADPRGVDGLVGGFVVVAHGLGHVGEVAHLAGRDHGGVRRRGAAVGARQPPSPTTSPSSASTPRRCW